MYAIKFLFSLFIYLSLSFTAIANEKIVIGVVIDGDSAYIQESIKSINKEIKVLTRGEFDVQIPKNKIINANWDKDKIKASLMQLYNDEQVDIVIALGFSSAIIAVKLDKHPKPTVASLIIDKNLINAPISGKTSGKHNLNYINIQADLTKDVKAFNEVVPFKSLVLISDKLISEVTPKLHTNVIDIINNLGIKLTTLLHSGEKDLISKIPNNVDAVLIGALPRMTKEQQQQLLDKLIELKLPSYSLVTTNLVEQGALVSTVPLQNLQRKSRRLALNLQEIILGKNASNLKVDIADKKQLLINMKTAAKLNLSLPFSVLEKAKKISEDIKYNNINNWSIESVAQEVIKENLDLLGSAIDIKIKQRLRNESFAKFLPQIKLNANRQKFKNNTENGAVSVSLSQVIYDNSLATNLSISNLQLDAQNYAYQQNKLDTIRDGVIAFLNVLKAKDQYSINQESVELSNINLELSQDKLRIGASSKADVYRWENEVALAKISLLNSKINLNKTKQHLNQLLNRPLQEEFNTTIAKLDNPIFLMNTKGFAESINNTRSFNNLSHTLIKLGVSNSMELSILRVQIKEQNMILKKERKDYILPTISLDGEYSNTYHNNQGSIPPDDWKVGINLSLALFSGGSKYNKVKRAELGLKQLKIQLKNKKSLLQKDIQDYLQITQAAKISVKLSKKAATASSKNLTLVFDSYSKGKASVVELVDAQNSSISSKLKASQSNYQFLIDLMNLQHSIGIFDFFLTVQQKEEMINLIKKVIKNGE